MDQKKSALLLFSFFSITLILIVIVAGVDFSNSIIVILVTLDLFLFLLLWYVGLGIIIPLFRDYLQKDPSFEIPHWLRILFPIVVYLETIFLVRNANSGLSVVDIIVLFLYIVVPTFLLYNRSWPIKLLAIIWTWFPIEWGIIDHVLGNFKMEIMPLDILLGIFSLLWPLITHKRHIPWYTWQINRSDLTYALKTSLWLTVLIVPLGALVNFLTFNPQNLLNPEVQFTDNTILNSLLFAIFVFYIIFLIQGLIEELLFRDIIFRSQMEWLENRNTKYIANLDDGHIFILLSGILIASIPFWDEFIEVIVWVIPGFTPVQEIIGSLAHPLGENEGKSIAIIEGMPLWPFYLIVAMILVTISLILYHKEHTPMIGALLASSLIFGFAHFEDFRYVFFASIAGFGYGYCYYKTKNIVASAMVHMGVDAIWLLLLSYN